MPKAYLTDCDQNGRSRMRDADLVEKNGVQMVKNSRYSVELRPDGCIAFLPLPTPIADAGPAMKTLVASFPGSGFTSEREGDVLNIYLVTGDPVATGAIGDHGRMGAAQLQAINKASRPAPAGRGR